MRAGGGIVEEAEGGGASQMLTDFSAVADIWCELLRYMVEVTTNKSPTEGCLNYLQGEPLMREEEEEEGSGAHNWG